MFPAPTKPSFMGRTLFGGRSRLAQCFFFFLHVFFADSAERLCFFFFLHLDFVGVVDEAGSGYCTVALNANSALENVSSGASDEPSVECWDPKRDDSLRHGRSRPGDPLVVGQVQPDQIADLDRDICAERVVAGGKDVLSDLSGAVPPEAGRSIRSAYSPVPVGWARHCVIVPLTGAVTWAPDSWMVVFATVTVAPLFPT
jgi:hypothetical protein